jgi:transcriptional regulator GlxA family with amidase domain/YHS domain-containing protein
MKRSTLLSGVATLGVLAAESSANASASASNDEVPIAPLVPSGDGVPVAFLLSDGATMIDFAGPWEVFQDAHVTGRSQNAFNLYTVAATRKPILTSGGATIVPQYSLAAAPQPKVIVVPAQSDPTTAVKSWLVNTAKHADLVMSVCTGALVLAQAGLLDGRTATTHHSAFATLAMNYPSITVKRGVRFVDDGSVATAAGLSAGIDLALHIVARYYGKPAAQQTAYDMEYQSASWLDGANQTYRKPPAARLGYATCAVCWMEIDPKNSPAIVYAGVRYYFCMPQHEQLFAANPQRFLNA